MSDALITVKDMTVNSKKETVAIHPDRVERISHNAWPSKKTQTSSIPMAAISGVDSSSESRAFARVTVRSSAGAVEVKLKTKDAERFVTTLRAAMTS